MTTIAYKDGVLAADTQVTSGGNYACGYLVKAGQAADGVWWAFSGSAQYLRQCSIWANGPRSDDPPTWDDDDAGALIIVEVDGAVREWWGKGWIESTAPFFAWGSGERLAMAAMHAGVGPERAVEIASLLDNCTGGDITVLSREG